MAELRGCQRKATQNTHAGPLLGHQAIGSVAAAFLQGAMIEYDKGGVSGSLGIDPGLVRHPVWLSKVWVNVKAPPHPNPAQANPLAHRHMCRGV